jgi:hypothetical protein
VNRAAGIERFCDCVDRTMACGCHEFDCYFINSKEAHRTRQAII